MGDKIPIQIIESRQLSADENLWLKDLNRLNAQEALRVMTAASLWGKAAKIGAYLDAVTRANKEILREVFKMGDVKYPLPALVEILEETGIADILGAAREAKGEERKAIDIAKNLFNMGLPLESVIAATGLESEKVEAIFKVIGKR